MPETQKPGDDIVSTTPGRRRRGKNVDRRRGQTGQVFQKGWCHGKKWDPEASTYVRYLVDVPGLEERKLKCVTLGTFRTLTLAEQAAREYMQANGVNDRQAQEQSINSLTFRQQADRFLTASIDPARRGGPVAQATYDFWRGAIDTWLNPHLGDLQLADVGNAQARKLIDAMRAAKRSDKTIVEYVSIMKSIVASAVDSEGEPLFPRQWNHDFMRLPIVDKTKQRRPKVTDEEVSTIIAEAKPKYGLMYALMAGCSLRMGEVTAIRVEPYSDGHSTISPDCRTIYVRKSVRHGVEQDPKTVNAVRDIDVAPELANAIKRYIAGQDFKKSNYLFQTSRGESLSQRNILRDSLHPILKKMGREKCGFHAFRRFRASWLRKNRVPWDLEKMWMGHAHKDLTDQYAEQLREDVKYRREWCEKIGLGFVLPANVSQLSQPKRAAVTSKKAA
jgi:integrase